MTPHTVFDVGFTIFACIICLVAIVTWIQYAPILNSIGYARVMVVWWGWMITFMMWCSFFGHMPFYSAFIYAEIPWPYVVSLVFLMIPYLNNCGIVIPIFCISVTAWVLKIFWTC